MYDAELAEAESVLQQRFSAAARAGLPPPREDLIALGQISLARYRVISIFALDARALELMLDAIDA